MRRALAALLLLALVLAAGLLAGAFVLKARFEGPGPAARETVLWLPPGTGLSTIAARLDAAGVIADPYTFQLGVRALGAARALKAGEYAIPPRASMREIAEMLRAGRVLVHRLTVPEGLTTAEVVALVARAEALSGPVTARPIEGTLLPDTYHYLRGESRMDLLARMGEAQERLLRALWPRRAPDLPLATPREAVILASIVEKETGVEAERPRVAAVFLNRLRADMPLQADPTVIYALAGGEGRLDRALTAADLAAESPYNTYRRRGLPPTPIANPGAASIRAVLQPLATRELYFVADGSGGHAFAETLAEHRRNVAAWRARQARERADEE